MNETQTSQADQAGDGFTAEIYSEDGAIRADYLDRIDAYIDAGDVEALAEAVAPLHESELGDLIETLEADSRRRLVLLLGERFDFSALTEVDEGIRLDIADIGRM